MKPSERLKYVEEKYGGDNTLFAFIQNYKKLIEANKELIEHLYKTSYAGIAYKIEKSLEEE